jgi:hypothetical protein
MVNTTQFYKTKVALAVVLSLGLAACGDSEGDAGSTSTVAGSTTTSDATQNTVANQNALLSQVTGTVQDTNGNPVVGATVYLAGAETTTNAGGQYVFNDVPVTNVAGVNNEGDESDDTVGTPLVITIAAEGHMGATVTVTPEAQVDNTGGTGDAAGDGNSNVTIQTYIDGMTAQAGTAQLPAISKRVYGYLRDCDTNGPLEGGKVAFDFIDVLSGTALSVAPGTSTTNNAAGDYSAVTDADGMFDMMVPADSELKFLVNGYLSTDSDGNAYGAPAVNGNITTEDEQIDLFLGTTEVCSTAFEEEPGPAPAAPFIKSIAGQIGTSELAGDVNSTYTFLGDHDDDAGTADTTALEILNYAALNQGVVNDFVINFSEEMASTFDMSEARVKVDGDSVLDATVTLSADGKSVTVTFADDLPEGSKVDVWFPYWLATDANDALFLVNNTGIGYDAVAVETTSKALYAHAFFCTFEKPVNEATVTLGPQIFDADTSEDGASADLASYSTAFQDNIDGGPAITQLNDGDALSGARLVALAAARGETVTIDQDYAVVEYDGSNAASLNWSPTPTSTTATTAHYDGTAHGTTVSVTPVNGFGDVISAGKMSVTLVDAIAPTTVLQESYNITDATGPRVGQDVVGGTTANAAFGNGGEVSAPGTTATAAGEPIIHIQPRHLGGDRNEELDSLTATMSARLTSGEVTALGGTTAAQTAMSVSTIDGHDMPIYDATAYAGWAAVPATIGVAFNENVTLTTTAPAYSGSTTLSGYAALNNVAADVDGNVVAVDLVTFETPSVMALSYDAGADLGFVGSVTDSRSNVSTANAQVFIQDTMPPMMTAAIWDGDTLELTFNEPVVITAGANINVINPEDPTTPAPSTIAVTTANSVVSGNTLTITLQSAENTALALLFNDGANGEFLYNDNGTAAEEQHALIDWDNIADATGNEWSEFNPTLSASNRGLEAAPVAFDTRRWEVVAPRFLAVNEVGIFTYTVATSGYVDTAVAGDDDGTVTYTISFTHPIELGAVLNPFSTVVNTNPAYNTPALRAGAINASTADANGTAMINNLFNIDLVNDGADNFVIATTPVSATEVHAAFGLTADHKTITLTVTGLADQAGAITFGTTTIGFETTVTSAINALQTSAGNFNWQNTN